jgi:hypothetical protein
MYQNQAAKLCILRGSETGISAGQSVRGTDTPMWFTMAGKQYGAHGNNPYDLKNGKVKRYRFLKTEEKGLCSITNEWFSDAEAKEKLGDAAIMRLDNTLKEFDE